MCNHSQHDHRLRLDADASRQRRRLTTETHRYKESYTTPLPNQGREANPSEPTVNKTLGISKIQRKSRKRTHGEFLQYYQWLIAIFSPQNAVLLWYCIPLSGLPTPEFLRYQIGREGRDEA